MTANDRPEAPEDYEDVPLPLGRIEGEGSWYPRPLAGTEPEWYGESADETYGRPYEVVSVDLVPDTSALSVGLAAAHRYELMPANVKYAAHLAAKLEDAKARDEFARQIGYRPWPSVMDELVNAAAEAFAPFLEAWGQIARAAADAIRFVMSVPSVRRYAYAEVDAKAEAEAIRAGRRYWTDHRGQPRRTPNQRPILSNGKANRRGY